MQKTVTSADVARSLEERRKPVNPAAPGISTELRLEGRTIFGKIRAATCRSTRTWMSVHTDTTETKGNRSTAWALALAGSALSVSGIRPRRHDARWGRHFGPVEPEWDGRQHDALSALAGARCFAMNTSHRRERGKPRHKTNGGLTRLSATKRVSHILRTTPIGIGAPWHKGALFSAKARWLGVCFEGTAPCFAHL